MMLILFLDSNWGRGSSSGYLALPQVERVDDLDIVVFQVDQVLRVERMRQAIMENLRVEFAKPLLPNAAMYAHYPFPPYPGHPGHMAYRPGGRGAPPHGAGPQSQKGRGRGILGNGDIT